VTTHYFYIYIKAYLRAWVLFYHLGVIVMIKVARPGKPALTKLSLTMSLVLRFSGLSEAGRCLGPLRRSPRKNFSRLGKQ
jgi:hypothetical protein